MRVCMRSIEFQRFRQLLRLRATVVINRQESSRDAAEHHLQPTVTSRRREEIHERLHTTLHDLLAEENLVPAQYALERRRCVDSSERKHPAGVELNRVDMSASGGHTLRSLERGHRTIPAARRNEQQYPTGEETRQG